MTQLIEKTLPHKYTEEQMEFLGAALLTLRAVRTMQKFAAKWEKEFPKSPYPIYFEMESLLKGNEERWPLWRLAPSRSSAKKLAEKMPPDDKRDRLLKAIDARLQQFHDLNPFAAMFDSFMDHFGGDGPDDEFDDAEDDGW